MAFTPDPPPPPGPPPSGKGPGIGLGVAAGFALLVLGVALMFVTSAAQFGLWNFLWPFLVLPGLVALLYFLPDWRRFATGILIIFAAAWIMVLGPCVALLVPLGQV